MIYSIEIDLRILFKKFYCPFCGHRLKIVKKIEKLSLSQKRLYYAQRVQIKFPILIDVGKVKQLFKCPNCGYVNTTDNQLLIRKKQKDLKKIILLDLDEDN